MQLTLEELFRLLKDGFFEEMAGMNDLDEVIPQVDDPEIRQILMRIRHDEEKHAAMFAQILFGLMGH